MRRQSLVLRETLTSEEELSMRGDSSFSCILRSLKYIIAHKWEFSKNYNLIFKFWSHFSIGNSVLLRPSSTKVILSRSHVAITLLFLPLVGGFLLMGLFISLSGLPRWLSDKKSACQCRRPRFNPWFGRSLGEENGNPLQCSCLDNPMDRGVWRATARGVAKSRTLLSGWAHNTFPHPLASSRFHFCFDSLMTMPLKLFFPYNKLLSLSC